MTDKHEDGDDEPLGFPLGRDLLCPRDARHLFLLAIHGRDDLRQLRLDPIIILGPPPDPSQVLQGLGVSSLGGEPSRGFLDKGDDDGHDPDEDQLHGHGDPPGVGIVRTEERTRIVDPIREGDPGDHTDLEQTGQIASDGGGGELGDVRRADGGFDPDPESGEETTGVLVVQGGTGGLEDPTDGKDETTDHDRSFSTDIVGQRGGTESTEEGLTWSVTSNPSAFSPRLQHGSS